MDKKIAGEQEILEFEFLCRALALHRDLAGIYEAHGLGRLAGDEWAKFSMLSVEVNRWQETWEVNSPTMQAIVAGRFKEKKSEIANRLSQIFREHAGMSRKMADEISDAIVRGRSLPTLALQKGWELDGTALAVGCEKIKRIGINPDYVKYVNSLEELAHSLGIDEDVYDQALEFMDSDELEQKAV